MNGMVKIMWTGSDLFLLILVRYETDINSKSIEGGSSMTTRNYSNVFLMIAAAAILMVGAIGCSQSSNPISDNGQPTPPPVEIKTPQSLIITSIKVTRFASTNNGDNWDWDPFSAAKRRPDIYVQLQQSGHFPLYISDERADAYYNHSYTFTKAASVNDGYLPREIPYGQTMAIFLVDDDFGGNQSMGSVTFRPNRLYQHDNANSISATVTGSNSIKMVINGTWKY